MSETTDSEGFLVEKDTRPKKNLEDVMLCPNCLKSGTRNADGSRPKLWNGEVCRRCGYRAMSPVPWEPPNHSDSAKKGWITRKMRYGLSGMKVTREPPYKNDELFA
jgi:hypothetical protein